MRMVKLSLLTNSSGVASASTPSAFPPGRLHAVRALYEGSDSGGDWTLTDAITGEVLLTITNLAATKTYYPRALAQDQAGANLTGWYDAVPTSGQIVAATANGGDTKQLDLLLFLTD